MKKSTALKAGGVIGGLLLAGYLLVQFNVIPSPMDLARGGPPQKDMVIDQAMRSEVLDELVASLNGYYVFPEKAKAMEVELRAKQKRGDYDGITSAAKFARTLTADVQRVTNDRHLDVGYSEEIIPLQAPGADPDAMSADHQREMVRHNYGVETVQRMGFNIGYFDLQAFAPADQVASRLGAAMTLLGDTEDLIVDLRSNHGGDPKSVELLASYLFDERTHLNDIYDRGENRTTQAWTHDSLAGPRYGSQRKVYLLISHDTFSAGEDFAYALKNLKRATLIGEATGGGAHPGSARRFNDHFGAIVPSGRSISPITHTDWEGVGVQPDVAIDADDALERAELLILKDRLRSEKDAFKLARMESRIGQLD